MEVRHDPQVGCENCDRAGRDDEEPPFYKVPFVYGHGRLCMEWHCGECVERDPVFTVEDEQLLMGGVEVEEVKERYLNGESPSDIIDWPEP